MRANEFIAIIGSSVVLVPYRPEHVQKYHEWMTDPELLRLTASEPLTIEEEYEMQRKWRLDDDKLTFIILARETIESENGLAKTPIPTRSEINSFPMVGDINIFMKGNPSEEDFEVEVEIMIAESAYRRKGCASQALQLILTYATSHTIVNGLDAKGPSPSSLPASSPFPISPSVVVARIGSDNHPSINLFSRLGFVITKRVEVFSEVEMRLGHPSSDAERWMKGEVVAYE